MKVVVTIDTSTSVGQEAFSYLKKLNAPEKSVAIKKVQKRKVRKLTDAEMGLPGSPPSLKELEVWLAEPDNSPTFSGEEVVEYVRKSLDKKRKARKGK